MNRDSLLFLTKDALCKDYLPIYGNKYWKGKTPNLDELAAKGTIYNHFFTAAPSSSMSYLSMFTRKYPYQQEMLSYTPLSSDFSGETVFDIANNQGYECHIIWDATWRQMAWQYTRCYGKNTKIHYLHNLKQPVGSHYIHEGKLQRSKEKELLAFEMVKTKLREIAKSDKKIFLWCHLPHVLNGRISYCDDIDLFDSYIGMFRSFFYDDNIFISADHGNMNGAKGKIGYGFDVYENNISIPFISPRIDDVDICDQQISNVRIYELLFERKIVSDKIIYSDSAYYGQPHRKLVVIYGKWRYIFNKLDGSEELYDIEWDPNQNFNLINDNIYDVDRKATTPSCEYYFYPYWNILPEIREFLRQSKNAIWRNPQGKESLVVKIRNITILKILFRPIYNIYRNYFYFK